MDKLVELIIRDGYTKYTHKPILIDRSRNIVSELIKRGMSVYCIDEREYPLMCNLYVKRKEVEK